MRRIALVSSLVLAACGGGSGDDGGVDAAGPDANLDGWTRLIGRTWTVPQGVFDVYKCTRIRVDQDIYLTAFRSQAPLGSHHAVLTIASNNPGTLGDYDCSVNTVDLRMLYASGVGTDDLAFPDGVGVHIPAGSYLNLNLHLFNAGDVAISGDSAVLVRASTTPPTTLADMSFAGDMNLNIPPTNQPWIEQGGCIIGRDYQVVALWPHMHQLAVHQRFELTRGGVTTVLLDDDYAFSNQRNWPQTPPLQFLQGDQLNVVCTYVNPGPGTVNWGDSSTAEMCFTGLYRYPAGGTLFDCISMNP